MKTQQNRLPAGTKVFAGLNIDRTQTLRFRLDGRLISGFAGDTVLSALLASGVDTLGEHLDTALGLSAASAPAILPSSQAADPRHALPMDRTPALDGADYVTLSGRRRNPFIRLFQPGRSLGLVLDTPGALDRPWRSWAGEVAAHQDIVIVGGGVAGLSAALAAARAGLSVTLLESDQRLGGNSALFGTQEGEDAPEDCMARLSGEVVGNAAITVLTRAKVFAVRSGLVRAHVVTTENGAAIGRVVDLPARFIILATGSLERLPLFAGNRLPGVVGALEAYELARRYAVWPGKSCALYTSNNPAYRAALAASDAGIVVDRLLDPRPTPNSRFIAFTRAHGMRHFTRTRITTADHGRGTNALSILTDAGDEAFDSDRLLVSGGWQPDLTLWHVAGGQSRWEDRHNRLEPVGDVDSVVLAGSAAGYFTRTAAIQSGADAVDRLLGRTRKPVTDNPVEAIYETPDTPCVSPAADYDAAPTYLDTGPSLLLRPREHKRTWLDWLRPSRPTGLTALSEAPQPLTVTTVASGVDLGLIPPEAAGAVAQERVALVPLAIDETHERKPETTAPEDTGAIPDYLRGRFGTDERLGVLIPDQPRRLEPGMLIFRSSDVSDPGRAIGVVLRDMRDGAVALVAAEAMTAGVPVSLRDADRAVPARLEPFRA